MDLISFTIFTHEKRLLIYNVELSTLVNICIPTALRSCALHVEQLRSPRLLVVFQSKELLLCQSCTSQRTASHRCNRSQSLCKAGPEPITGKRVSPGRSSA